MLPGSHLCQKIVFTTDVKSQVQIQAVPYFTWLPLPPPPLHRAPNAAVPGRFGTGDWFHGRQFLHGKRWGEGVRRQCERWERWGLAHEALLTRPLLSSCSAAWFLRGRDWDQPVVQGLGTPAPKVAMVQRELRAPGYRLAVTRAQVRFSLWTGDQAEEPRCGKGQCGGHVRAPPAVLGGLGGEAARMLGGTPAGDSPRTRAAPRHCLPSTAHHVPWGTARLGAANTWAPGGLHPKLAVPTVPACTSTLSSAQRGGSCHLPGSPEDQRVTRAWHTEGTQ